MRLIAKTFKNLEPITAGELRSLGATDIEIRNRAVSFSGDKRLLYQANFSLRTASRVLIVIDEFTAKDYDEIYASVSKITWEKYISVHNTFSVNATTYSDVFTNSQYVRYRVKDSIADYFRSKFGKRPNVDAEKADVPINIHISGTHCTILLDSSGASLHKRGWRVGQASAPLNEALAAGLILHSGWHGQSPLYDPFCGSGTILIEACMIALGIQPGIYRKDFAFQHWTDYDKQLFQDIYDDDSRDRKLNVQITGSDISHYALQTAQRNIDAAGLTRYIKVHKADATALPEQAQPLTVITNPPYGVRIKSDDLTALYKSFGRVLKFNMRGSEAWVLSGDKQALKEIGLKHKVKIEILNGDIECLLLGYDIKP